MFELTIPGLLLPLLVFPRGRGGGFVGQVLRRGCLRGEGGGLSQEFGPHLAGPLAPLLGLHILRLQILRLQQLRHILPQFRS